jgi:hypothetical protein
MDNIKQLKKWIPEIYLIASVVVYWVMTGTLFNLIAILLLLVLAALIVIKNNLLGITISLVLLILNLYMVLALVSELMDFPSFNRDAQKMLLFGSTYFGLNIFLSITMFNKWRKSISPVQA